LLEVEAVEMVTETIEQAAEAELEDIGQVL
jgi:hypothetical protein